MSDYLDKSNQLGYSNQSHDNQLHKERSNVGNERYDKAIGALYNVIDPELGLDIVNLGLVYSLVVGHDRVYLEMTLTTLGCPVSESLPQEAEWALRQAFEPEILIEVKVVWDPPWTPERMSEKALELLGWRAR